MARQSRIHGVPGLCRIVPLRTAVLRWPTLPPSLHGGPDDGPPVQWDFSTNSNPLGPLAPVAEAVAAAPRQAYPEPGYRVLRERIAELHGVSPSQVIPAGSAGEWIWRFTLALREAGGARRAWLPAPGYAEYGAAARALGIECRPYDPRAIEPPGMAQGDLLWLCTPHNPTGSAFDAPTLSSWILRARSHGAEVVLDLAYAPLRFDGASLPHTATDAWQLWSPNKACGLTGVRGAYALAPAHRTDATEALRRFAPAWVMGADGVAMVEAFARPATQQLLARQHGRHRDLRDSLAAALQARGWMVSDSVVPFVLARPPAPADEAARWHAAWRAVGLKLRDAASFGLPGWLRIAALPLAAQQRLLDTWDALHGDRR